MAQARDRCTICGKDTPFKLRAAWRLVRLTRPLGVPGAAIDEGVRLVCGNCLLPLRDAWLKREQEKS